MEIKIKNTDKIIQINGVPARLWEGTTESGIKVHCFVTRIAIDKDESRIKEFEKELIETSSPFSEMESYPTRLIL